MLVASERLLSGSTSFASLAYPRPEGLSRVTQRASVVYFEPGASGFGAPVAICSKALAAKIIDLPA